LRGDPLLKLGAHIDFPLITSKEMFKTLLEMGLNAVQIFLPCSFKYPSSITELEQKVFKENKGDMFVAIHTNFSVFPSVTGRNKNSSVSALLKYLLLADQLGVDCVVTHVGPLIGSYELSIQNIINVLSEIFSNYNGNTSILLENSAGGGKQFVCELLSLTEIIKSVPDTRLGFVYDTAHGYASGAEWDDKLVEDLISLKEDNLLRLVNFNMNDPKSKLGKHLDRHSIAIEERPELRDSLLKFLKIQNVPFILERGSIEAIKRDIELINSVIKKDEK
jgi:deoxyribonuclease-4